MPLARRSSFGSSACERISWLRRVAFSGVTGFASVRVRDVDTRFTTGGASGTQDERGSLLLYKSLDLGRARK